MDRTNRNMEDAYSGQSEGYVDGWLQINGKTGDMSVKIRGEEIPLSYSSLFLERTWLRWKIDPKYGDRYEYCFAGLTTIPGDPKTYMVGISLSEKLSYSTPVILNAIASEKNNPAYNGYLFLSFYTTEEHNSLKVKVRTQKGQEQAPQLLPFIPSEKTWKGIPPAIKVGNTYDRTEQEAKWLSFYKNIVYPIVSGEPFPSDGDPKLNPKKQSQSEPPPLDHDDFPDEVFAPPEKDVPSF